MTEQCKRLEEIKDRARQATPGPWKYNPLKCYRPGDNGAEPIPLWSESEGVFSDTPSGAPTIAITGPSNDPQSMADARFIAHCREDIAWLIAEVERLQSRIEPPLGEDA